LKRSSSSRGLRGADHCPDCADPFQLFPLARMLPGEFLEELPGIILPPCANEQIGKARNRLWVFRTNQNYEQASGREEPSQSWTLIRIPWRFRFL
jgi:hypothetical protein